MTASAATARSAAAAADQPDPAAGSPRPLALAGVMAAVVVTAAGLAVIVLVVLIGWIAAPHDSVGLPAVLRAAAACWLVGHHVGFSLRGAGRIGMLPLGLVLLPGALLWRAGRWVVRVSLVRRLRHVGYAAVALAVPYSLLTTALAIMSRSVQFAASVPQAALCGLLLAAAAGGLGGARELAPWGRLTRLIPERQRSVVIAIAASGALLAIAGALLAATALAANLHESAVLQDSLGAGPVGTVLLLLLQIGYVPNAIIWAVSFAVGPGFAFGTGTIVAPTGSALGSLPAVPLLAALPPGVHASMPGWLAPVVMALPYLAGATGGWLLIRMAPTLSIEAAPLWGFAAGALTGLLMGVLAAFSGGPLGDGRLTTVGPSGWQVAAVAAFELGIAAAISAGVSNYLLLRQASARARAASRAKAPPESASPEYARSEYARSGYARSGYARSGYAAPESGPSDDHILYLNPWEGDEPAARPPNAAGPSALP